MRGTDPAPAAGSPPPAVLGQLAALVERHSGIVLGEEGILPLRAALAERMRAVDAGSPWEYVSRVVRGPGAGDEVLRLVALLVVGETGFFRTPSHFRLLKERVLPSLARDGAPLAVWCAGCATGEEAYSIAIAALETPGGRTLPLTVTGTDIHPGFLATARAGVYPAAALAALPPALIERYFNPAPGGRFAVAGEVRRLVAFEEGNLADPGSGPPLSSPPAVIFCRNVMIYFRPSAVRDLVARFHALLAGGGALFLGHSETLYGVTDAFRVEEHDGAFCYRKAGRAGVAPNGPAATRDAECRAAAPAAGAAAGAALLAEAVRLADRGLLADAEAALARAMERDPSSPEAPCLAALLRRRRGDPAGGLRLAEQALSRDPLFVLAAVEAAECLDLLGRRGAAGERWTSVLSLLEEGARFPRLPPATGLSAAALAEVAAARLRRG